MFEKENACLLGKLLFNNKTNKTPTKAKVNKLTGEQSNTTNQKLNSNVSQTKKKKELSFLSKSYR